RGARARDRHAACKQRTGDEGHRRRVLRRQERTTGAGGERRCACRHARLDLFGPDLAAFMKRAARGLTRINAFGEGLPNIENRIELASDKDEFGMPLAKIVHSYDQDAAALWNANFEEGLKIAKATDAKEVWSARGNMPTIHLMG